MPAREFRAVQRSQFANFAAQTAREQIIGFDPQHLGNHEKLQIRDPAALFFEPGDGFAAGVPPEQLQFHRKAILGPAFAQTQRADLRANDIQMRNAICDIRDRSRGKQGVVCALLHITARKIALALGEGLRHERRQIVMKSLNIAEGLIKRVTLSIHGATVLLLLLAGVQLTYAKPRPTQPPWPSPGQTYREGFDQPYQMPTNQVIDQSVWSESWSGWALNRSSLAGKIVPWVVPMLATNGAWNLDPQRGTLRLWYRPEYASGSGPGHLARLLTLVSARDKASAVWWTLAVSGDGSCLQLLCETANGPEVCASAPVKFQAGDWHLLTLGYTETNCAIFLDDQEVASGGGLLTVPVEAAPFTSLIIGGGFLGDVAAGQIDEFAAFTGRSRSRRESVSPFGIDPLWEIQGCWARLNPVAQLGPITPEEEAATQERALARRAARQATTQERTIAEEMMTLDGGGDWPEFGETNGFWLDVPVIESTNITLTLINAATNTAYDIYFTPTFDNGYSWTLCTNGSVGQAVFTVVAPTGAMAFFRAYSNFTLLPTVETPVFSPTNQYQLTPASVTISCGTTGATICYTLNGVIPTLSDLTIASGSTVSVTTSAILMARAFKSGYTPSAVQSNAYSIHQPPIVGAGAQQIITGSNATLQGSVTSDGFPGVSVTNTWSKVRGPGTVTFADLHLTNTTATFSANGVYELQLVAEDGTFHVTNRVVVARNPTVSISIIEPTNGSTYTVPTNFVIRATVTGSPTQIVFYAGSTVVGTATSSSGTGGYILDWKTVLGGSYPLTAVIYTSDANNSGLASAPVNITVNWPTNVGQVSIAATDLAIPVAGPPIAVNRNYDSRYGVSGMFGYNGKIDYEDILVSQTGMSSGWLGKVQGSFPGSYCILENAYHLVTVALSESEKYYFTPKVVFTRNSDTCVNVGSPDCSSGERVRIQFLAVPGGQGQLGLSNQPSNLSMKMDIPGGWANEMHLSQGCGSAYEPPLQNYTFIAPNGTQYQFDTNGKLAKKIDRNGNALAFADSGITYSNSAVSGSVKRVKFTKASGRITELYDPLSLDASGNISGPPAVKYAYDGYGNLTNVLKLVTRSTTNYEATAYRYDNASFPDHITRVVDPRGVTTVSNVFDSSGRLLRQYDAIGNYTAYSYDPSTRRQIATNKAGGATTQTFTYYGLIASVQTPDGGTTTYDYDSRGRKTSEVNPLGATNTFAYDSKDNLIGTTNELGQSSSATFDSFGLPLITFDGAGKGTTNGYDARGNLAATTNALGIVTRYGYDAAGNRTAQTNALGLAEQTITLFQFNEFGYLTNIIDALGSVTTQAYDANGNRSNQTQTRTTFSGPQTLLTRYQYDAQNRVIETVGPDGFTNTLVLNGLGKQEVVIDKLGRTNRLVYDPRGLVLTNIFADGLTESFAYDAEGRKTSSTDRAGRVTTYTFDLNGRPARTTFPDGTYTENIYDAAGRVTQTLQGPAGGGLSPGPNPRSTSYYYDAAGRRTAITNALGQGIRIAYDANGNITSQVDALGRTNTYFFDSLNRQVQVTFADGSTEKTAYDAVSRRVAFTNQAAVVTRFAYDALSRLAAVTNAFGTSDQVVTRYAYDEVGNQTNQFDALGRNTAFEYDAMGRRTRRTLPGGQSETMGYDAVGNLLRLTNFNGAVITNQFDALDRLTNRASGSFAVAYAYSATGQRTNMLDASGEYRYSYDSRDRQTAIIGPAGTLAYTHDAFGSLFSTVSARTGGAAITNQYDALNRLTNVLDAAGSTIYGFDTVGNLQTVLYPNNVTNTYTYNTLYRLTNLIAKSASGTLASFTYNVAQAGNRTNLSESVNGASRTFAWNYNQLYRLTNETITGASPTGTIGYNYDAVGNRTSRTSGVAGIASTNASYTTNDWVASDNYDSDGNTTNSAGNSYQYDVLGHLTNYNNGAATFVYNGDGIRVRKMAGGTTTLYLVDERNPSGYAQVLEEISVSAGTTNLAKVYTYGLDLISQRDVSTGTRTYYGYDGNGNTRYLTTTNGTVSDTYAYDAFGTVIASSGGTSNSYRYGGEQLDSDLGFYYLRSRYFNAGTGRFWSRDNYEGSQVDPASLHKYAYCAHNPVNFTDPSGRLPKLTPGIRNFLKKFGAIDLGIRVLVGIRVTSVLGDAYVSEMNAVEGLGRVQIDRWIGRTDDDLPIDWITRFSERPDILDLDNNTIYEIKPDNPASIRFGIAQIARYQATLALRYPGRVFAPGTWEPQQEFYEIASLPGITDLGIGIYVSARNAGDGVIAYRVHPDPEMIASFVTIGELVLKAKAADSARGQLQYGTASLLSLLSIGIGF